MRRVLLPALLLLLGPWTTAGAESDPPPAHPDPLLFLQLASPDRAISKAAMERIAPLWRDAYTPMVIDIVRLIRPGPARRRSASSFDQAGGGGSSDDDPFGEAEGVVPGGLDAGAGRGSDPATAIRRRMLRFLERQTGQKFGEDLDGWRRWMWKLPYEPHPDYALFKGGVYGNIDPRLREFFPPDVPASIRLDQVDWGGVGVNGIPPLNYPQHLPAAEADYLRDRHVVFGIVVDGQARAYPKRILAWHEMARDRLGGRELTVVYCTLCGTVIPYDSVVAGRQLTFGTSGLLYKSNKLMFDEQTRSLWSTVYGRPVVGPLVGSGLQLTSLPVVTTTWGEWRELHPDTTVLSLATGFQRDYDEGAAYRDYFSHDRLMFAVDARDERLDNKAEVLVLGERGPAATPLAIAVDYLGEHRVLQFEHDGRWLLVLTTPRGASRVYGVDATRFVEWEDATHVRDASGGRWRVAEEALIAVGDEAPGRHPRIAAHRAFWFGWYAQYPQTRLIH